MFDFIVNHKRVAQVILALIVLPFAFFGIDFYFRDGGTSGGVAKVGRSPISEQEYAQALRQAQDRMRETVRNNPALAAQMESPEFKQAVLNDLIQRRVLVAYANRAGMAVPDAELQRIIGGIEAFRDDSGKFSMKRYEQLLRAQGMTPASFEARVAQDMMLSRMQSAYAGSAFVPDAVVERMVRIREQQREVSQVVFSPGDYRKQIQIPSEEAKKFYDGHGGEFRLPERVKVEFVILTPEAAAQGLQVSEEDVRKVYQERINQYRTPEKRKASHILVAVGPNASEQDKSAAKAKAQEIYQQLEASPKRFAELARKYSQDPGSAEKGGDLGEFERGFMVKPFDDAVFQLKVGEISPPVQTQYGYHIIRLDGIKPSVTTPFEKARAQILEDLRKERRQRAFTEAAQTFGDMVYEQYDSLKPVADKLKLTIQKSDWIGRDGNSNNPLFGNPKLLEQLFATESLDKHRNTEAVEVQPNMLLSARVVEHAPASALPFDQVKGGIVEQLVSEKAAQMAEKEGRAALERLRKGEAVSLKWSAPLTVTLGRRQGLHPEAVAAVFGADTAKLPAYAGASATEGRFVVYRISKLIDVQTVTPEQMKSAEGQLAQLAAQDQFAALMAGMRERTDIKVNMKKLLGAQQ